MPRGGPRKGAGRKRTKPGEKPVNAARPRKRAKPATPPPPPPPESNEESNEPADDHEPITTGPRNKPEPIAGAEKLTTLERQRLFLEEFAQNGNVLRSCQRLKIARATVYGTWVKEPEFKAAFEQAAEDATDLLEEEARRRAIEGVPEPHFYEGNPCGYVQKYSDSLLMFLLKGKREAYREKRSFGVGVESGVTGGLRKVIVEIDESPGASA
jgi:hypothetical protein